MFSVNIHTHDGRFVFYYSHICNCINFHSSFLHTVEDNSIQKSQVCILTISKFNVTCYATWVVQCKKKIQLKYFLYIFFHCFFSKNEKKTTNSKSFNLHKIKHNIYIYRSVKVIVFIYSICYVNKYLPTHLLSFSS